MAFKCIGCDSCIPWDGKGTFCYTCACGAHIFYNEETGQLAPPASLVIALHRKTNIPHLDYLVGEYDYTSPIKEKMIQELVEKGAIWMRDCEQCLRDGTYQRKLDREKYLAVEKAKEIMRSGSQGPRTERG
ncbi:unnamed protein product [marine sediment metagenome]|uniref:Uncharacterized protein n=1 Tax=marine sediment metagenome TaxID=412755 RepID=X1P6S6_9ZZZZ